MGPQRRLTSRSLTLHDLLDAAASCGVEAAHRMASNNGS